MSTTPLQVKIINKSPNPLPAVATVSSAGMDLRAFLDEPIEIEPLSRFLVPTGLYVELPEGTEAQVRPRSGLALKYGITVLNAPGTIDADYRGEIKVLLVNLSNSNFYIQNGDRIAQLVVASYYQARWQQVKLLSSTSRSMAGYGSTGTS